MAKGLAFLSSSYSPEEAADLIHLRVPISVLQKVPMVSHPPFWWKPSELPDVLPTFLWALVLSADASGMWLGPVNQLRSLTIISAFAEDPQISNPRDIEVERDRALLLISGDPYFSPKPA